MRNISFLLDANMSPETAVFLRSFGFDAKSLIEENLGGLDDGTVAQIAAKEKRVLVTFDLDFGEMYYFSSRKKFSVVVLRFFDQRVETVNTALGKFFTAHRAVFKNAVLVVLREGEARVIQ